MGRSQSIIANGAKSSKTQIINREQKDNVRGPLLFVDSLSNMPSVVQTANLMSYSGHTKVSQAVRNRGNIRKLEKDLQE